MMETLTARQLPPGETQGSPSHPGFSRMWLLCLTTPDVQDLTPSPRTQTLDQAFSQHIYMNCKDPGSRKNKLPVDIMENQLAECAGPHGL